MREWRNQVRIQRGGLAQGFALMFLLVLGGLAVAGPSGLLAWGENQHLLSQRQTELVQLQADRDVMKNRVALLNPRHVDPDLTGELLRRDLNVLHPDEVVMILK